MNGNKNVHEDALKELLESHPDIEIFEAIVPDLNGRLRGKWVARDSIAKVFNGELKLPISTLAFDVWGRDPESWVYEQGDEDGLCVADAGSLAPVPWLSRPTAQIVLSLASTDGKACAYDTRTVLSNALMRCAALGLTPVVATEMEFYLLGKSTDVNGVPGHTQTGYRGQAGTGGQTYGIDAMQEVAPIFHDIRDACRVQNLPVDTLIAESAPSQYEINLHHQADALLAADQGMLLQRAIKGVANHHDLRASFMAKPFAEQAGNGMHIHCSMLNQDGDNTFDNGTQQGNEVLRHAVAGCLASLSDCMLIFAPHRNSYRRLQPGSHAPTAPNWGYENRTTAIRIPAGTTKAMRIEHRIAGADASPHLVVAAIVAGMTYGIENRLEAPAPIVGDAYQQSEPSLPNSWQDALARFSASEFVREYLGAEFQSVFAAIKQQEYEEFQRHITPLEYESYL